MSFLTSPIDALVDLFAPRSALIEMKCREKKPVLDRLYEYFGAAPLREPLAAKVRAYIGDSVYQSQPELLEVTKNFGHNWIGTQGSITHLDKAYIVFSREYADFLNKQPELTDEAKFLIAHEISHIKEDDYVEGEVKVACETATARLLSFAATGIALGALAYNTFRRPYLLIPTIYVLATGVSELAGWILANRKYQEIELRADIAAATKSREIALAGAAFYEKSCAVHQKARTFEFWKSVSGSLLSAAFNTLKFKILHNSEGDVRIDFRHPALGVRRVTCAQIAGISSIKFCCLK